MKPCEFIEKLATENKSMADALENKRFAGMKRILADFYPDNAHFIYELLQNAEDTYATKITFELKNDRLIYKHNGKRTFTERDIESITSIGDSSKADDINSIGKFGVGFKAVFSYTNSPQIYSGAYAFEINNLVLPRCVDDFSRIYTDTIFIFPFNHPKKSKLQAFEEIKAGLEKLHENTLLFLKNISEISVITENKSYKIKRNEIDDIQVEIHNSLNNTLSRWLRFKKPLPDYPNLYVSVAYALGENEKTQKDEIIPISGEVSIFFPAEKETSNLKFHIHAPFASTVARDSFKHDNDDNKKLIELIAETVTESFDYIKKNDLLTLPFLGVLPNSQDNIAKFYHPIIKESIQIFKDQEFTLTDNGSFQPSDVCYRGSANLKKLIDGEDLKILTSFNNVFWVKNAPQRNGRIDNFISDLNIDEFTEEIFIDKIQKVNDEDIRSFLTSKNDEWYFNLYVFMYEYKDKYWIVDKNTKKIIRLRNDILNIHGGACYFENEFEDDRFSYAKMETYTATKKTELNQKAKDFLESLGVKDIGEKEKISTIFDLYKKGSFPSFDEHIKHLKLFLAYYRTTNDGDLFKEKYLFSCIDNVNIEQWCHATSFYIDEPFELTGLKILSNRANVYFLNDDYAKKLSKNELAEFMHLLTNLGTQNKLEIITVSVNSNPEYYSKLYSSGRRTNVSSSDWSIEDLLELLSIKDKKISELIWKTLSTASKDKLQARNKVNNGEGFKYADSKLVNLLKENSWIPDQNGNFYKPCDIDAKQLPLEFVPDNRNGWLSAIGFGENIRKNKQEYKEKEKIAKEITGGHSLEDIEALKAVSPEKLKEFITQQKQLEDLKTEESLKRKSLRESLDQDSGKGDTAPFVESRSLGVNIADEVKYAEAVKNKREENTNAFGVRSVNNQVQDTRSAEQVRMFLEREYEGRCQICGDTKAVNGKNYFMMHSLNAGENRDVNVEGNSLCLCPNHFAIFRWKLRELVFWNSIKHLDTIDTDSFEKVFGKQYDFVGKDDINEENDAFYNLHDDDDFSRDDIRFLPVKIFEKTEYIKITKAHEIEILNELNRK